MRSNCSNLKILPDFIVMNGVKKILLHHIDLFYELRYLYATFDLKWFCQWCQTWGFAPRSGVFNAILGIWVFRQEIWCF